MNQIAIGFMCFVQMTTLPAFNVYKLADAIYQTQGNYATSWPSGTLNNTEYYTSRKDCLNIIRQQARKWDGNGDFIEFLAKSYSPLNIYWAKKVKYYYQLKNKGEIKPIEVS